MQLPSLPGRSTQESLPFAMRFTDLMSAVCICASAKQCHVKFDVMESFSATSVRATLREVWCFLAQGQ